MGVTWIFDPISSFFPDNKEWFYATDVLNCLQGFIIFILLVIKKKVYKSLKKR